LWTEAPNAGKLVLTPMELTDAWRAFAELPCEETFRPLYDGTKRLVWTLCVRILGDEAEAQDAFQGAYARILVLARELAKEHGSIRGDDPASLVARSAIKEADRLRKARARRQAKEPALGEVEPVSQSVNPPGGDLAERETRETVERIVAELPEKHRLAVQLHFFHGLSQREVAEALDVSVSTVSERIQGAIRKLDPAFRRAGLGPASGALAGIALGGALLEPRLSAAAAFQGAQALASSLSASSVTVSTAITTTLLLGGLGIMKTKAALLAAAVIALLLGAFFIVKEPTRKPIEAGQEAVKTAAVARPAEPAPPPEAVLATTTPRTAEPPAGALPEPAEDRITGAVTDAVTREPIPGAVVRAEKHTKQGTEKREAVAGEDGVYVLESPGAGEISLIASAEGHARGAARVTRTGPGASEQHFALDPAFRAKVLVADVEGRAIEGAGVTPPYYGTERVYHGDMTVHTDNQGAAWLEDLSRLRPAEVMVEKSGYQRSYVIPRPREGNADAEHKVVLERIALTKRVIVGRVTDASERPIAGAVVEWKDGEGTSFGSGAVYGQFRAVSGPDGFYRLEYDDDYPTCELGVSARGWGPAVAGGVRAGTQEQPTEQDFVLTPAHWLAGRVVDEAGKPLEQVKVVSMPRADLLNAAVAYPSVLRETSTDEDGRFRLEDLAGPKAAFSFRARDRRPELETELEVSREVEIALPGYARVHGTVTDAETGAPVTTFNVKVSGVSLESGRAGLGETFTSSEGKFALEGLDHSSRLELFVEAEGYVTGRVKGVDTLQIPSEGLKVEFSRGQLIEGVVVDALTGAPIPGVLILAGPAKAVKDVEALEWKWLEQVLRHLGVERCTSAADGSFQVREAEPSTLFARAVGRQRLLVEPPERKRYTDRNGQLRLPLAQGVRLTVTCHDGKEPARRATVVIERAGDDGDSNRAASHEAKQVHSEATTDGDGRCVWDDLSPGPHVVRTTRKVSLGVKELGLEVRRRLDLLPGDDRAIDLGKDLGPHELHGLISGMEASESLSVTVTLRPLLEQDGEGEELRFVTYKEWGWRYRCPYLRPGRWRVEASYWHAGGTRTEELEAIEVTGGGERDLVVRGSR